MNPGFVLCLFAAGLLAGCEGNVKRVTINEGQLVGKQRITQIRCPLRLKQVVDARSTTNQSGGLGWNQVVLDDAPLMVQQQLLKAGLLPATAAQGRDVVVKLKHMYMSQNHMTKNPVVVYEVVLDGGEPFIVRAQPTKMNWNSSTGETLSAFSSALRQANDQLLAALNQRCSVVAGG
jgi:hypothetical protein